MFGFTNNVPEEIMDWEAMYKNLSEEHEKLMTRFDRKVDELEYEKQRINIEHTHAMNDLQTSLTTQKENEISRLKAKHDAEIIVQMENVRKANNAYESLKETTALAMERVSDDAESRIKTAENAANAVLANAQLEAIQIVKTAEARGMEKAAEIIREASEDAISLYEDVIEKITSKFPVEGVKVTDLTKLITAATENYPTPADANVTIKK